MSEAIEQATEEAIELVKQMKKKKIVVKKDSS